VSLLELPVPLAVLADALTALLAEVLADVLWGGTGSR
jgi:hypothetical protein